MGATRTVLNQYSHTDEVTNHGLTVFQSILTFGWLNQQSSRSSKLMPNFIVGDYCEPLRRIIVINI